MMNKKDIGFKEYSKKVALICATGIIFIVFSMFLKFFDIDFILAGYAAVYGAGITCACMLYRERNRYASKLGEKHKKYAVIAIFVSVVFLCMRIFYPDFFTGTSTTRFGGTISAELVATLMLTAIFASPLTDFMFVFNNTKITDTHISSNSKEN